MKSNCFYYLNFSTSEQLSMGSTLAVWNRPLPFSSPMLYLHPPTSIAVCRPARTAASWRIQLGKEWLPHISHVSDAEVGGAVLFGVVLRHSKIWECLQERRFSFEKNLNNIFVITRDSLDIPSTRNVLFKQPALPNQTHTIHKVRKLLCTMIPCPEMFFF